MESGNFFGVCHSTKTPVQTGPRGPGPTLTKTGVSLRMTVLPQGFWSETPVIRRHRDTVRNGTQGATRLCTTGASQEKSRLSTGGGGEGPRGRVRRRSSTVKRDGGRSDVTQQIHTTKLSRTKPKRGTPKRDDETIGFTLVLRVYDGYLSRLVVRVGKSMIH